MTQESYHTNQPFQSFNPPTYRAPLRRTSRQNRCPECGEHGYCEVAVDGSRAHCMNRPSPHPCRSRLGGWWHYYRDDFTPTLKPQPQVTPAKVEPQRANIERIHAVFTDFRRLHLVLSEQHREALRKRGLSDAAIEFAGYRSTPPEPFASNVARSLAATHDLHGVPGFHRDADSWRMVSVGNGFFVPVRDHAGRICGMQIRRDEGAPKYLWFSSANRTGGASSGAPISFAKSHLLKDSDEVTVTEGALKADITAHLLNAPVIGIAGVATFGEDFAANLKQWFPRLRRVACAFDMDVWHKPQVAAALDKLITQLERATFTVRVRTWAEKHKGIDDYLVAQARVQEVAR